MHVFNSRRLTSTLLISLLCVPSIVMCTGNADNNNKVPFYQDPIALGLTAVTALAALGTAFCEYKSTKHKALRAQHEALISKHETKIQLIDKLREIEKNCQDDARRFSLQKRIDDLTVSLAESCLNS